jgi:hypothetical protein
MSAGEHAIRVVEIRDDADARKSDQENGDQEELEGGEEDDRSSERAIIAGRKGLHEQMRPHR